MKKLTLTVTEETYRSARVWATQCNTSVSALVRNFLEALQSLPCPGVNTVETNLEAPAALPARPFPLNF